MRSNLYAFILLLAGTHYTHAATPILDSDAFIPAGNAVVPPETIETIVRKIVIRELKGRLAGSKLRFKTPAIQENIPIQEPQGDFKEILHLLGLKSPVQIEILPMNVDLTLPESGLKIEIISRKANHFDIRAQWSVENLNAESPKLKIKVPKGFFDESFEILSTPVEFGLNRTSNPIYLDLRISADLSGEGTKVSLDRLTTNLTSSRNPSFFLRMGVLTVDGKPLRIELNSNGKKLVAEEPHIRKSIQKLEPEITQSIRKTLTSVIAEEFNKTAKKVNSNERLKLDLDFDQILSEYPKTEILQTVLKGLSIKFAFSYLQFVQSLKIFSGQVTSSVCVHEQCIYNVGRVSPISSSDLETMKRDQEHGGVLVYESWLQNIFHSPPIQNRIQNYFEKTSKNKGTKISKHGVRVHLQPETQSVVLVANLEIDIKRTAKENANWGARARLWFGDKIEWIFGSGKIVKIPIEVRASIKGITQKSDGRYYLSLHTDLPFRSDGTLVNTYHYPSNVDKMTKSIRKDLFEEVANEVSSMIGEKIEIPLGKGFDFEFMQFQPTRFIITPNHALLLTGRMK